MILVIIILSGILISQMIRYSRLVSQLDKFSNSILNRQDTYARSQETRLPVRWHP